MFQSFSNFFSSSPESVSDKKDELYVQTKSQLLLAIDGGAKNILYNPIRLKGQRIDKPQDCKQVFTDILPSQQAFSERVIENKIRDLEATPTEIPIVNVYRGGDKLFVLDGQHRFIAAIFLGRPVDLKITTKGIPFSYDAWGCWCAYDLDGKVNCDKARCGLTNCPVTLSQSDDPNGDLWTTITTGQTNKRQPLRMQKKKKKSAVHADVHAVHKTELEQILASRKEDHDEILKIQEKSTKFIIEHPSIAAFIYIYTTAAYKDINAYLRSGTVSKKTYTVNDIEYNIPTYASILVDILQTANIKTKDDIVLYRGLKDKFWTSDTIHECAFTSLSASKERALHFAGPTCCLLHVTVPRGFTILYVSAISRFQNENEFILLPHLDQVIMSQNKEYNLNVYNVSVKRPSVGTCRLEIDPVDLKNPLFHEYIIAKQHKIQEQKYKLKTQSGRKTIGKREELSSELQKVFEQKLKGTKAHPSLVRKVPSRRSDLFSQILSRGGKKVGTTEWKKVQEHNDKLRGGGLLSQIRARGGESKQSKQKEYVFLNGTSCQYKVPVTGDKSFSSRKECEDYREIFLRKARHIDVWRDAIMNATGGGMANQLEQLKFDSKTGLEALQIKLKENKQNLQPYEKEITVSVHIPESDKNKARTDLLELEQSHTNIQRQLRQDTKLAKNSEEKLSLIDTRSKEKAKFDQKKAQYDFIINNTLMDKKTLKLFEPSSAVVRRAEKLIPELQKSIKKKEAQIAEVQEKFTKNMQNWTFLLERVNMDNTFAYDFGNVLLHLGAKTTVGFDEEMILEALEEWNIQYPTRAVEIPGRSDLVRSSEDDGTSEHCAKRGEFFLSVDVKLSIHVHESKIPIQTSESNPAVTRGRFDELFIDFVLAYKNHKLLHHLEAIRDRCASEDTIGPYTPLDNNLIDLTIALKGNNVSNVVSAFKKIEEEYAETHNINLAVSKPTINETNCLTMYKNEQKTTSKQLTIFQKLLLLDKKGNVILEKDGPLVQLSELSGQCKQFGTKWLSKLRTALLEQGPNMDHHIRIRVKRRPSQGKTRIVLIHPKNMWKGDKLVSNLATLRD